MSRKSRNRFCGNQAASFAEMIRSGLETGSPRLILSTFSIPAVTLPQTVYWPLSHGESAKQMKNWLSAESGLCARAMETVPRTCFSPENSALSFLPSRRFPCRADNPFAP